MRDEKRDAKRAMIAEAAYGLIEERGYSGTSMLAIAKAARASNETLYNWYGDKLGLFAALVEENSAEVLDALEAARAAGLDRAHVLDAVGAVLVHMVLSPRAIALNRAAAADATGTLGAALAKGGRARVAPLIRELITARYAGDVAEITETYLALLIGDRQIRRAIGVLDAPDEAEAQKRALAARNTLDRLYPTKG